MPSVTHPFRIVEPYLDGFLRTEALLAALQLGVVDALWRSTIPVDGLADLLQVDRTHLRTLIGMLVQHDVLHQGEDGLSLSEHFREALEYRDLLEARLDFAHRVRSSMSEYFALSIRDPRQYQSKLVNFYKFDTRPDYPESVGQMTRAFVRHMSTYTRYCAPVLLDRHDFSGYRRVLDIGGNNGEIATQLCRKHPDVEVTILDIPAVCDIGIERVREEGLSERITYVKGDARVTPFPEGFDAVLFSSVLHDHDEETIALFLSKAQASLLPGGRLILFETYAFDYQRETFAEYHIELIPFFSYFGPPDRYVQELTRLGLKKIETSQIDEIRYLLTTAQRPGPEPDLLEERLRLIVESVDGRNVHANEEELWFEVEALPGVQTRLSSLTRGRWYDRSTNFAICYSGQLENEASAAAFQQVVERIKGLDSSHLDFANEGFQRAATAVAYPTASLS